MQQLTAVLLGAGDRGMNAYAPYALKNPAKLRFVAVAEPDCAKREKFCQDHQISSENAFVSWEDLLSKGKIADILLVCTQDQMHFEPTIQALELGYDVLLEKPMSGSPAECLAMAAASKKQQKILAVCHVLRYTNFFSTLKKMLSQGRIGRLVSIQHNEDVGYWHQAHSFVRGNWRHSRESNPMILAKSCHDMDIMYWLADSPCVRVASFGGLTHFKKSDAPQGAPAHCLEGCPAEKECPYYAPKWYLTENTGWPTSVISTDSSYDARVRALKEGPYGRCVYHCDNDVVDHQVVIAEFANEVTASFTMAAFNKGGRFIKLMGTNGYMRGNMEKNEIELFDFKTGNKETAIVGKSVSGHGGGDFGIIADFIELVKNNSQDSLTSADKSLQSHFMAFAAEKARVEHKVVEIGDFMQSVQ